MSQWKAVHSAIKRIQDDARAEFQVPIGEDVIRTAIDGLIELRIADAVTNRFEEFTTPELLIAQEILNTDKKVMAKVAGERKGDLN